MMTCESGGRGGEWKSEERGEVSKEEGGRKRGVAKEYERRRGR